MSIRMGTSRGGFTFIEMLLVMVLGVMLLAGAYGTLARQEQGYRHMTAMAATQQDTRTGIELLSAELREISAGGADLLMATPDSLRFRALRKFGILCDKSSNDKKLTVAQLGADPFAAGDSLLIYVDQDSLTATDDYWVSEYVQNVGTISLCGTTLGLSLGTVLASSELTVLQLPGAGLKFDSVYAGAPIRSFEILTYRTGDYDGEHMLLRRYQSDAPVPLFGPVENPGGLALRYFDGSGNELTSFPLNAADRASVRRVEVKLRAQRITGGTTGTYTDSLVTEIFFRGG